MTGARRQRCLSTWPPAERWTPDPRCSGQTARIGQWPWPLADWPAARITGLWEHHAVVAVDGDSPRLGEVVSVVPNHVCTAVNLVPELLVADQGQVADRWPVAARAANR